MMTKPRVSIVVIFRDEVRFLDEAIQSVFHQSFGEWDLTLVDDGSVDGSSELATAYAAGRRDRVRYLEHENHSSLGPSASRNLGFRGGDSEYVAFLDGDDVWLPHKLAEQVAILDAHPAAALVHGTAEYWYSWTGLPRDATRDFVRPVGVEANSVIEAPELLARVLESRAPAAWPSDLMVRRNVLERVGGFEEPRHFGIFEDQTLLAKVLLTDPSYVSDRCWFRYRRHDRSASAVENKFVGGLAYVAWLETYLAEAQVDDERLQRALRAKRARYERALSGDEDTRRRRYVRAVTDLVRRAR
jgi:glycosyltransferase involved in cell wall biosynthesis